jgi:hypothetical protein
MESELSKHDNTVFQDENGNVISTPEFQRDEQLDAYIFIPRNSTVLDLGTPYGITSCLINRFLFEPTNHVVVESNISVIQTNKEKSGGKFHIFNGLLTGSHINYDKSLSFEELELRYSLKFDTLIADKCILPLISNIVKFKIIFLKQSCKKCDNDKIKSYLEKVGFFCISDKSYLIYVNMNMLPFKIVSYQIGHAYVGLFGQLGYVGEYNGIEVTDVNKKSINTLSVHGPSRVIIETNKELLLMGYCSPTSKSCPNMIFKCDKDSIGSITSKYTSTPWYKLLPGKHELIVEADSLGWAHSVWIFQEIIPIDQYLKIDFTTTGWGLFNQLISFINGLIIANQVNRHVYEPRFLVNYDNLESIPISSIINIDQLNQILKLLNIDICVIKDDKPWIKSKNHGSTTLISKSLAIVCENIENQDSQYLDIGNTFNLELDKGEYLSKIEKELFYNIPFTSIFYDILDFCKENYLTNNYSAVHLRLEDDWIDFTKNGKDFNIHSENLLSNYFKKMEDIFSSNDNIYLATHLLKLSHANNYMIDIIKLKYPNMVTNIPWRNNFNLHIGREIDALVDYIICINSEKFLATSGSTFSAIVCQVLSHKHKITSFI